MSKSIEKSYELARQRYAEIGIDTEKALEVLVKIPISIHCWQGDDVGGFENPEKQLTGGIMATGGYPGKARTIEELRKDFEKSLSLIPGKHRINLHAIYADMKDARIARNKITASQFTSWVDWAKSLGIGMDFNGTFFSHPMADSGFTLSSPKKEIRDFWIEHAAASRKIGEYMGKELGNPCVVNIWIPDGMKDIPANRRLYREILKQSLDKILAEKLDKNYVLDSVESKLFGLGSESYVVGSHEFYLSYAVKNNILLCLDSGHFHPTEVISDKISSLLLFLDSILLHVSRGVRWDSDHVVILNDELQAIANEITKSNQLDKIHIGLDFFDASINRVAAWVIGARSMIKALLIASLTPQKIAEFEADGDYTSRLALQETCKTLPFGAVWDYYCLRKNTPIETEWLAEVKDYEKNVLSKRA